MKKPEKQDSLHATREELLEIAKALGLDDDPKENKWLLWDRILWRSKVLWQLAMTEEASDEERKDWPWTE